MRAEVMGVEFELAGVGVDRLGGSTGIRKGLPQIIPSLGKTFSDAGLEPQPRQSPSRKF